MNREKFQPNPEKRAAFREKYGIGGEDEWVVLTVAQQTPRKGIYDFLDLSHKHPDTRFVWVGGFPPYGRLSQDYSMIEEQKSRSGKNVLFTGFVDDITAAYCSADLFFIPPSFAEGSRWSPWRRSRPACRSSPGGSLSSPGISGIPPCTSTTSRRPGCCSRTGGVCSGGMRRSPGRSRRSSISGRLRTATSTCTRNWPGSAGFTLRGGSVCAHRAVAALPGGRSSSPVMVAGRCGITLIAARHQQLYRELIEG
ncbi:hypothetical protein [Methanoculleus chikugoensis]|uniref:hypothetical protein n=1 Tax=Methanoculleus chikugoensis TaxID=118126 RepID=UPI000AA4C55E|nr:hypothetical protein [Methanoculleus chikugoensis]